jgi:oligopeptide/dipeptide ABC transporter ATP-binding protein
VSALDASNRNYILRLLGQLRNALGLSIVIISHDLSSLAGIADRVAVLYRGRIVEDGPVDQVFAAPQHPYTALLMASAPSVRHDRELFPQQVTRTVAEAGALPEDLLAGLDDPGACVFATRCAFAAGPCAAQPPLVPAGDRRHVACHRHTEWMTLARARTADGRTTEGQPR